ncbi:MAG: hypothetical protein A2452_09630 [Candidatus Firestonebacteria bacterium RIFOXYC2_FULL_39_67]|nr:MAG: hypothetical protein A2536_07065 [Candidatus Firestonebacteria bacterium RIFOXYD2_FULL_39_29]OGF54966.1 MAG: hypothetical protein A2497_04135 [Candidatus Firestonebacteria bacterium RifOxyC12_full_39_7]OGF56710.1 MAG: hypothetical protein A2452_09630 [Candidatus Firestonebacteria bacterium RIFOXYC2_FULL_39_67]
MKTFKSKIPALLGVLAFFLPLSIYVFTTCPTVFAGDSGELITAAFTLGVAHPPGYPLFCLLGKLFSYLSIATIAFRVNLVAGFFAALSVYVLYLLIKKLISGNMGVFLAFCGALLLAFSGIFWEQALFAKGSLYMINSFLIILLYYLLVIEASPILLGFVAGLSLTNHHTALIFVGMAFLFLFFTKKDRVKALAGFSIIAVVTAIAVYLYLPFSASSKPPINWGNPKDLESALFHIFRVQYGDLKMPLTLAVYLKKVFVYGKLVVMQFDFISLMAIFGIFYLFKSNKVNACLLLFSFVVFFFPLLYKIENNLTIHVIYMNRVFFIPLLAISTIWIAAGFAFLLEKSNKYKFLYLIPVVLPFLLFGINYRKTDRSKNFLVYDYGVNTFKSVEKDAILFTSGDHSAFISTYLKVVEKARPDITCYDDTGSVFENIYGEDFLRMNKGMHEQRLTDVQIRILQTSGKFVYFVLGNNLQNLAFFNESVAYKPYGLVYKITREEKGSFYRKEVWRDFNIRNLENFKPDDYLETDLASQIYFMKGEELYYRGMISEADKAYDRAIEVGRDVDTLQNNMNVVFMRPEFKGKMLKFAQDVVKRNPYQADAHSNMGNAYILLNDPDNAILEYKKSLEIEPKSAETRHNMGVAYMKKKDYENAAGCFKSSVELYPVVPADFINLMDCYAKMNRITEAVNAAATGARFHPNSSEIRMSCGNLLLRANRYEEALENYEYIVKNINAGIPEVYNNIGVTLLRMKRVAQSEAYFKKAVEIKPEYNEARKNLKDVREFLKNQK